MSLTQHFRTFIYRLFRKWGWEVQRISTIEEKAALQDRQVENRRWQYIRRLQPKTVLDIGANTGQFAERMRQELPGARIISFEPLEDCVKALKANKRITQPFEVFQCALGNESGKADIHHNAYSPSSSLLPTEDLHVLEWPVTGNSKPERVEINRLDDLRLSLSIEDPLIVKIDVQGFEDQVLLGGRAVIAKASVVMLEVSSYPLYQQAPSFDRIYQLMREMGFVYRGNTDQWQSRLDGRILQFDAFFERGDLGELDH